MGVFAVILPLIEMETTTQNVRVLLSEQVRKVKHSELYSLVETGPVRFIVFVRQINLFSYSSSLPEFIRQRISLKDCLRLFCFTDSSWSFLLAACYGPLMS